MDGEVAHLPLDGVAKLLGLRGGTLQRDAHIPQGAQPRAGVDVLRPVLGRRTGGEVEHGETEHIRGLINIPAGLVDGLDALVIGDQDVDFTGNCNFFRFQRGVDAGADVGTHNQLLDEISLKNKIDSVFHFFFHCPLISLVGDFSSGFCAARS